MSQLIVRLIGISKDSGSEKIFSTKNSDSYNPDHLEQLICLVIDDVVSMKCLDDFRDLEVSISLTSGEEENIRPALHLSILTIKKLASINAELDFDPYV